MNLILLNELRTTCCFFNKDGDRLHHHDFAKHTFLIKYVS